MLRTLPGMTLFRSLNYRPFALMWGGQAISRLGDSLYMIALAWWVLEKTGSATVMGTVLVFSMTPMLLFLLIGGVAVDRFPRLRVMLVSDVLSGIVVIAVAILAMGNLLEVWHVYVASVVFGLVAAFFQPAYTAAVPEVVPEEALPSANSLGSLSGQVVGILGPASGAAIVALGGTTVAFALDGLSFFVSAACLVPLVRSSVPRKTDSQSRSVIHDFREGLSTVLGSPWLWVTIALAALGNMTSGGPISIALPFLIKNDMGADVGLLGTVYSMSSVGSIIAALWLGRKTRIRRRGIIAYGALIMAGMAIFAAGFPISATGLVIIAPVFGASMAAFALIWMNTLQELVPRERLGRVSSIDYLGSFVLLPVGYGITGWATDQVGAPMVFMIGGAISMALAVLGLLHPAIRGLD